MYSSSMESIQVGINKLLNCGYISFEEIIEKGKHKKVYFIAENGKQHFGEWINRPIEEQGIKSPELVKVYFMGFADKGNRETSILKHLDFLKEQYCVLEAICGDAKNIEVCEEIKHIFHYQMISAFYGRDGIKFNIDWYEHLLSSIRSGEI